MDEIWSEVLKLEKRGDEEIRGLENILVNLITLLILKNYNQILKPELERGYKDLLNQDLTPTEKRKKARELINRLEPSFLAVTLAGNPSLFHREFTKTMEKVSRRGFFNTVKILTLLDPNEYSYNRFSVKTLAYSIEQLEKNLKAYNRTFVRKARDKVIGGILDGKAWGVLGKEFSREVGIVNYKAERLIRTESMRVLDYTKQELYKDSGVEQLIRIATNDRRVCIKCAKDHGRLFPMGTSILYHPNDRCTFAPFKDAWVDRIDFNFMAQQRIKMIKNATG